MSNERSTHELTEEQLRDEVRRLRAELKAEREGISRRGLIASAATAAALGAAGIYTSGASAQTTPSGTFPVSTDDPLLKIRADRVRFVPRSSDPSSPSGGTMWVVK